MMAAIFKGLPIKASIALPTTIMLRHNCTLQLLILVSSLYLLVDKTHALALQGSSPEQLAEIARKAPIKKHTKGAGVGRLVLDTRAGQENAWKCHYDMVLVERIQGKPKAESGLFLPDEELPRLHLCRVLALGPGREEENGLIAPMPDIKIGDIVISKNPWGIGPKDEETADGKKLSYMRAQDVAAVVTGGILPEE